MSLLLYNNDFLDTQVECKKAQPKEAVQAANTAALLGKRVILSNLGMMPSLGLPSVGVPQQPQQQAFAAPAALQAALQQQLAASAALGMLTFTNTLSSMKHRICSP